MVRIGFTSRNVLVGLAILPVLFQTFGEVTEGLATRAVTAAAEELLALGLWFGVLVVAVLVIAGVTLLALLAVAAAFLRFHDFELRQDGSAFRSRAGLLTRKEVVVERAKIQQVSVAQGLIMVRMGCCRLKMLPATSGAPSGNNAPVGAQTLHAPLVGVPELADLRARVFGEEGMRLSLRPDNAGFTAISPFYIRARLLSVGILPALVATAALVPAFGLVGLLALAWPLPVLLAAWQSWRRRGYLFDDDGLVSRRGLLGYSVDAFLFRKAQGATVRRSPLQRRQRPCEPDGALGLRRSHGTVPGLRHGLPTARTTCCSRSNQADAVGTDPRPTSRGGPVLSPTAPGCQAKRAISRMGNRATPSGHVSPAARALPETGPPFPWDSRRSFRGATCFATTPAAPGLATVHRAKARPGSDQVSKAKPTHSMISPERLGQQTISKAPPEGTNAVAGIFVAQIPEAIVSPDIQCRATNEQGQADDKGWGRQPLIRVVGGVTHEPAQQAAVERSKICNIINGAEVSRFGTKTHHTMPRSP